MSQVHDINKQLLRLQEEIRVLKSKDDSSMKAAAEQEKLVFALSATNKELDASKKENATLKKEAAKLKKEAEEARTELSETLAALSGDDE